MIPRLLTRTGLMLFIHREEVKKPTNTGRLAADCLVNSEVVVRTLGFEGAVVVNRKDWGITWNAALEAGGILVSEKVTLEFELSAVKS